MEKSICKRRPLASCLKTVPSSSCGKKGDETPTEKKCEEKAATAIRACLEGGHILGEGRSDHPRSVDARVRK